MVTDGVKDTAYGKLDNMGVFGEEIRIYKLIRQKTPTRKINPRGWRLKQLNKSNHSKDTLQNIKEHRVLTIIKFNYIKNI